MVYETKFLISLALTLLIEIPLAVVIVHFIIKLREVSLWQVVFVSFIASALTLPYLWFIVPRYVDARLYIIYGEIFITLVEGIVYNQLLKINIWKALLLSLVVNMASYYFGVLVNALL